MENASKALIIAGAILLSILLISLGIMVYNNAKGTISDANIDSEEAQAFNTKITQYCGTDKSGATMNSLIDAIAASNGAQNGKASPHGIKVSVTTGTNGVTEVGDSGYSSDLKNKYPKGYPVFDNAHKYTAKYETKEGYIFKVTISNSN